MTTFNEFISNTPLVIFCNAYFVFHFILKKNFLPSLTDKLYFSNPIINNCLNFFSNDENIKFSKKTFLNNLLDNKYEFKNGLIELSKNKFKKSFYYYDLKDHATSLFINYEKRFIVFFNSNKVMLNDSILKNIIIYLNLIKKDFLESIKESFFTFDVYIVNSGKQLFDAFCLIYSHIFLFNLLETDIDNPKSVIEACNKITIKDTCNFFYEKVYLRYKEMIDKLFLKKETDHFYNSFLDVRREMGELKNVSCLTLKENSLKSPLKVFNGKITLNYYTDIIDVYFRSIKMEYFMNTNLFEIHSKREVINFFKNKSVFKKNKNNNIRILNFFSNIQKFLESNETNFNFYYNLREMIKEVKNNKPIGNWCWLLVNNTLKKIKLSKNNIEVQDVSLDDIKDICVYLNTFSYQKKIIELKIGGVAIVYYTDQSKFFIPNLNQFFYVSKLDIF